MTRQRLNVFGSSFTDGYPGNGEVSAIYLRQDCIGKGYGHELFAYVEKELADMDYTYSILDVFTANKRAIDFYKAHGYTAIDERLLNLGGVEYPYIVLRKRFEKLASEPNGDE